MLTALNSETITINVQSPQFIHHVICLFLKHEQHGKLLLFVLLLKVVFQKEL